MSITKGKEKMEDYDTPLHNHCTNPRRNNTTTAKVRKRNHCDIKLSPTSMTHPMTINWMDLNRRLNTRWELV